MDGGARPLSALLAGALFFGGPVLLIAAAVSLRTARAIESYRDVMERVLAFREEARRASDSEAVDVDLILAVASAESSGRADAVSSAGAVGLMQLKPDTAAEMAADLGEPSPDLRDPATSLRLGARYLRRQMDRFAGSAASKELALAAYNAGPNAVQAWLAGPPPAAEDVVEWIPFHETRVFVRRVLDYEARFRGEASARRGN